MASEPQYVVIPRPLFYEGISLHNPRPNVGSSDRVELYGYSLSEKWLEDYTDERDLHWQRFRRPYSSDLEAKQRAAIAHIRRKVLAGLGKVYGVYIPNILPSHRVSYPPVGSTLRSVREIETGDPERERHSIMLYFATNEDSRCIRRSMNMRVVKAFQKALGCPNLEPRWISEGLLKRYKNDLGMSLVCGSPSRLV